MIEILLWRFGFQFYHFTANGTNGTKIGTNGTDLIGLGNLIFGKK